MPDEPNDLGCGRRPGAEAKHFREPEGYDHLLRHYAAIQTYLLRLVRCHDTAADLAQETYYRALRYYKAVNPPRESFAWLCAIARNVARDYCRRRKPSGVDVSELDFPDPDEGDQADDALFPDIDRVRLREAIDALPPPRKALIVGFYFDGKSCAELGEEFGIRRNSVKILLFRARRRLRVQLRNLEGGSP